MAVSMTGAQALALLDDDSRKELAAILLQAIQAGSDIQVLTLDLGTARTKSNPYEIGSYRTIIVSDATDTAAKVYFRPNTKAEQMGSIPLTKKDVFGNPLPWAKGYLHWDAQTGKTMTLVMLARGDFRSGSQISQNSGGVSVSDGALITSRALTGLAITSAASILAPADSDRKVELIYNGEGETVWLGDASVTIDTGTNPGIPLLPGSYFEYRNTAALYAIKSGAGTLTKFPRMVQR